MQGAGGSKGASGIRPLQENANKKVLDPSGGIPLSVCRSRVEAGPL